MFIRQTIPALTIAVALLFTPACGPKTVVVNPPAPVVVKTPAQQVMLANRILSKEAHLVADITKDARDAQVITPAQAAQVATNIEKILAASTKVAQIQQLNPADWAVQVNLAMQGAVVVWPDLSGDPKKALLMSSLELLINSVNSILIEVRAQPAIAPTGVGA